MALRGTYPESYITEYTLVYEEKTSYFFGGGKLLPCSIMRFCTKKHFDSETLRLQIPLVTAVKVQGVNTLEQFVNFQRKFDFSRHLSTFNGKLTFHLVAEDVHLGNELFHLDSEQPTLLLLELRFGLLNT